MRENLAARKYLRLQYYLAVLTCFAQEKAICKLCYIFCYHKHGLHNTIISNDVSSLRTPDLSLTRVDG